MGVCQIRIVCSRYDPSTCPPHQYCNLKTLRCEKKCTRDAECYKPRDKEPKVCNPDGICIIEVGKCRTDADCIPEQPFCFNGACGDYPKCKNCEETDGKICSNIKIGSKTVPRCFKICHTKRDCTELGKNQCTRLGNAKKEVKICTVGIQCNYKEQCKDEEDCVDGQCILSTEKECMNDNECGTGYVCDMKINKCKKDSCNVDRDCKPPAKCVSKRCLPTMDKCKDNNDCPPNTWCHESACILIPCDVFSNNNICPSSYGKCNFQNKCEDTFCKTCPVNQCDRVSRRCTSPQPTGSTTTEPSSTTDDGYSTGRTTTDRIRTSSYGPGTTSLPPTYNICDTCDKMYEICDKSTNTCILKPDKYICPEKCKENQYCKITQQPTKSQCANNLDFCSPECKRDEICVGNMCVKDPEPCSLKCAPGYFCDPRLRTCVMEREECHLQGCTSDVEVCVKHQTYVHNIIKLI